MQKIIDWIIEHQTLLLLAAVVVLLVCAYRVGSSVATKRQAKQQKPAVVTQEQTQDAKALQQQLDISRANAEALRQQLATVQAGQRAPVATYYVTPTVERAAQTVEKQIKADDPTLPMAAREKSDRTVVTPITKDNDGKELPPDKQRVDVYKVNLRKDHRIKAGATMVDGKAYATIGYEQGRFEALMHFDGTKPHGASVMYNVVEW